MNPNTSVADSSKHGQSKMEEEKSILTGKGTENQALGYASIKKIKLVFQMLIDEMPFLIEKKVLKECEGKSEKEIFTLKIDAIRKSLEISSMEDVELLVKTFYDWSAMKKAERE